MSRSPTFAEFNPTGDDRVAFIKVKTDEIISYLYGLDVHSMDGAAGRRIELAVENYEQAAMWAVKAMFS